MVSFTRNLIFAILVLIAAAGVGLAQRTTATFAGIVQDSTDAVLPGAEAELVNEGTSASLQRVTNETGEFVFDFVPVGTYTLRIRLPGFRTYESRGIVLGAAQNVRRTYTLEVGAVTDSVTVTGEAALVNTLSPEQRSNLDTLQIANLPIINRNITSIIEYSGSGLTKGEALVAGAGGVRYRMNGLGGSSMSASADGGSASGFGSSMALGGYGGFTKIDVMSADAVGEVQVVKGVIPAEYSGLSGHLSLITKSGTNDWHGSLFHRYEGSALSARQPILRTEPNSVWNQFGGSLGGPVVRDKAFFFFAYEGYRQRTTTALVNDVPTPYFRNLIRQSMPFPETDIWLKYYTLPNQPHADNALLARWVGPGISNQDDDHVDAKVDYLVAGGNLSVTFAGGHPSQLQAAQMPLNPRIFSSTMLRGTTAYVIGSGRWTSSTRVGINFNRGQRLEQYWNEKDPNRPETVEGWRGVPAILYTGMTNINQREKKQWGIEPSWSIEEQVSIFRGAHSLKFGGVLNLRRGGAPDTTNAGVSYQSLDDILQNTPSSVNVPTQQGQYIWSMNSFGFFVQDDWRATRKLVLNVGLRYDRYGAFVAKGKFEDTPAAFFNLDGLLDSVNFLWGPLRDPMKPMENDNMNLGPRFGFAYTADSQGDFVVRGGFGVNFSGFDAAHWENQVGRRQELPYNLTFSRGESVALGLKFPVYNEDVVPIVLAQNRPARPSARVNPNFESPYAMNYTLGIQRALTPRLLLETAFVGSRGVKFNMVRTFNKTDRLTGIRFNPDDIQGSYIDNSQQTNYNSWQTSLKQRLTRGLSLNVHHTWGKALSYTGGDVAPGYMGDTRGSIEDFDEVKIERSVSTGDVAHSVSIDWVYQAPTLFANSALARQVLGGWQISGIWKARTGLPLGVSQTGGRPDIIDFGNAINTNCCSYGNLQYLNPAAFQRVTVISASSQTFRRGHANSAPLRGPGIWNVDLSLGKSFGLTENTKIELKADMLNALNHTQYTSVATNLTGIGFGGVTGTASARVVQLQLRLAF
jgi:hypothetical protein